MLFASLQVSDAFAQPKRGDYFLQALKFCQSGDKCVAVKNSCNTYDAVRDIYVEDAKQYFRKNAVKADCVDYKPVTSIPVATCASEVGLCTLTPVEAFVIDPRMMAPN